MEVIRNIRTRYDGAKRSPFNEAECGHHYARAMASWASVIALSGFQYSAIDKSMTFTSMPVTYVSGAMVRHGEPAKSRQTRLN